MTRDKDGTTCTCGIWTVASRVFHETNPLCPLHGDDREPTCTCTTAHWVMGEPYDPDPLCPAHGGTHRDPDLDYGDWQAEQAYEKYVADQEAVVETDSEPTTLHTGLEDTAADVSPVAVKRHPGTLSPSLQDDEAMRQERIAQPYLDMERVPRASLQDIILDRLAREGRQPPPMTQEQAEHFFDQRHGCQATAVIAKARQP